MKGKVLILSTAPHNFAGAGTAHARTLALLARSAATVYFFCPAAPFRVDVLRAAGIEVVLCDYHSDAYASSDAITCASIAEHMTQVAKAWVVKNRNGRVVLLATYLFPFCQAVQLAATAIKAFVANLECVLVPAGSDVWQIGRQLPAITKVLLEADAVTSVVTYSERFAAEIVAWIGVQRQLKVIPPPVDTVHFAPFTPSERAARRAALGIGDCDLLLCHCSNHRPVKGLGHVLEVSIELADRLEDTVHLVLVGPITSYLCELFIRQGIHAPVNDLPHRARKGRLQICCVGLQQDTRYYHGIADVALNMSLHDSFNISVSEAMACEVPIASTDVAGVADLVEGYRCGVVVPFLSNSIYSESGAAALTDMKSTLDVHCVVDQLAWLCSNAEQRWESGKRARQAVVERCADSVVERAWGDLLQLGPARG